MSRHHIQPPVIYTPPPPKRIESKKRRTQIGSFDELDETAETGEAKGASQPAPVALKLPPSQRPEIEGTDRKPQRPEGRLSQTTLSVMLQVQEVK